MLGLSTSRARADDTVAVVIGGANYPLGWSWSGAGVLDLDSYLVSGEIFGCEDVSEVAKVPDLPMPLEYASAVYWPEKEGVLICGGLNMNYLAEKENEALSDILMLKQKKSTKRPVLKQALNDIMQDTCLLWQPSEDPNNWVEVEPMNTRRWDQIGGIIDSQVSGQAQTPVMVGGSDGEIYPIEDMERLKSDSWNGKLSLILSGFLSLSVSIALLCFLHRIFHFFCVQKKKFLCHAP